MRKLITTLTTTTDGAGIMVALGDLSNVLNILLLTLSIIGILTTLIFNVYDHIKQKDYAAMEHDFQHATDTLQNVINKEDKKNV